MDLNNMNFILDMVAVVSGIYCLYTWIKLCRCNELFPNSILIPSGKSVSDCIDEEGYIEFIRPRMCVLAFATLIYGCFLMINDTLEKPLLELPWNLIPLALIMVVLVWYAVISTRATREYFA